MYEVFTNTGTAPKTHGNSLVVTANDPTPVKVNGSLRMLREDLRCTHEEADVTVVFQAINIARASNSNNIVVRADDTDIFCLLIHYCNKLHLKKKIFMESPKQHREIIDIQAMIKKCKVDKVHLDTLLAAHAISGCDTAACYYSIGKVTALNVAKANYHLLFDIGNIEANHENVVKHGSQFLSCCYGSKAETMTACRKMVWAKKTAKSLSSAPDLCTLPPTSEAAAQNILRSHLQAIVWKHALAEESPHIDPSQYGWEKDHSGQTGSSDHSKWHSSCTRLFIEADKMLLQLRNTMQKWELQMQ